MPLRSPPRPGAVSSRCTGSSGQPPQAPRPLSRVAVAFAAGAWRRDTAAMTEVEALSAPVDAPARSRGPAAPLTGGEVLATWWPLAASWLLMGLELPMVSAVLARLPHPTVSLAAYGG